MHNTHRPLTPQLIAAAFIAFAATTSAAQAMPKAAEDNLSPVTSAPAAIPLNPAKTQAAPTPTRKEAKKTGKATPRKSVQPEQQKTGAKAKTKRK